MRRLLLPVLFCVLFCFAVSCFAQESSSQDKPVATPKDASHVEPQAESPEIANAEAAMAGSDWKTAKSILDSWLTSNPTDDRALFDAGYIADAQGQNDAATAAYRKALAANPKCFEAEVSLGLLLARTGKTAEAREALWTATTLDAGAAGQSAKARAWRALAQIDMRGYNAPSDSNEDAQVRPDPEQASIDLLEALKLSPETGQDTLLAASLGEANGDAAGAEAAYRRALKTDPNSTVASAGLAHLLIAQKKYPEAQELLTASVQKSPDDPALTAQLAAVLVAEDKDDALPLLQQFHLKHPKETAITRMLAQVEADAGEYPVSDQLYTALLAASPKDEELLVGHGQNLIRLHRYPEAQKAFESATEIDETNGEAWNGLAFASVQTHQPSITVHALTVRSKYLPETPIIYFLWATAYDNLHDKKQAVAYYRRFLDSSEKKFPDQEWQARQRLALLEKSS